MNVWIFSSSSPSPTYLCFPGHLSGFLINLFMCTVWVWSFEEQWWDLYIHVNCLHLRQKGLGSTCWIRTQHYKCGLGGLFSWLYFGIVSWGPFAPLMCPASGPICLTLQVIAKRKQLTIDTHKYICFICDINWKDVHSS